MDYLDNIINKNNNSNNINIQNYQNKIFTNLNLDIINGDAKMNLQIENLKEKIKERESEIFIIMKNQKDEYERIAKEKDLEISTFVDKLVCDNDDFKKQVLELEIEKEYYKETLNEYKKNNEFIFFDEANLNNTSNNISHNNLNISYLNNSQINQTNPIPASADRLFFQSIKYINEVFENKKIELAEKYELINYNFIKEKGEQLNLLKNFNLENYFRNYPNAINRNEIEGSLIPIELLEEQFLIFENKIKFIYEDLKTKETQILITENKYDLLAEENRAIKRKFNEEKKFLLIKINDIKCENEKIHKQIIKKLEEEIRDKKITLEKRVNDALKINEQLTQNLFKEKNELSENLREVEKKYWMTTQDLEFSEKERRNWEDLLNKNQIEIDQKTEELRKLQEENKIGNVENDIFLKAKQDLTEKLNIANTKIYNLEIEIKNLNEKLNLKIRDNDKLLKDNEYYMKIQTERLNKQIIEKERKTDEIIYENEKLLNNIKILEKKIANDDEIIKKFNKEIEKLKLELNEIKLNNKNLMNTVEEKTIILEKSKNIQKQNEVDLSKKEETLRNMRETFQKFEKEHNNHIFEIEKLSKIKKDLIEESNI